MIDKNGLAVDSQTVLKFHPYQNNNVLDLPASVIELYPNLLYSS